MYSRLEKSREYKTTAYQVDNFKNTLRTTSHPHLEFRKRYVNGIDVMLPFEKATKRYRDQAVDTMELCPN